MTTNPNSLPLVQRDLRHIFHPCTQMKDCEVNPPIPITGASGCYLFHENGIKVADAISSWWCKTLGHGHPRLREALIRQANHMEHIISAGTTTKVLVELSEVLCSLVPGLDRVFYSGDGSMAVEVALKMSVQAQVLKGCPHRNQLVALEGGYHGESTGALSVSELGLYKAPYTSILQQVSFCPDLPLVTGKSDPLWESVEEHWPKWEKWLDLNTKNAACIILEPIVQGAGGMRIYSPDFLRRLRTYTSKNGIYLIADEIMTGFGRTGKMLAIQHAGIVPDLICLSKGLTAGWMPFSATLLSKDIYDLFYGPATSEKSFLHSNTYSGNLLGASIALEAQTLYRELDIAQMGLELEDKLRSRMEQVREQTGLLGEVRALGGMVAAELINVPYDRPGFALSRLAMKNGLLLRPLGKTVYWLPPLNASDDFLDEIAEKTHSSIHEAFAESK